MSFLWGAPRGSHSGWEVRQNMASDCGFYCAAETDILLYRGRCNALEPPVAETQGDRGHIHIHVHDRVRYVRLSGTDLGTLSCASFRQQGLEVVFLCYLKTWSISTDSVKIQTHTVVYPSGSLARGSRYTGRLHRTGPGGLRTCAHACWGRGARKAVQDDKSESSCWWTER